MTIVVIGALRVNTVTVQSLYNTPHYKMDSDVTRHFLAPNFFTMEILQKNYKKITIK